MIRTPTSSSTEGGERTASVGSFTDVLDQTGPRPDELASREPKKKYSEVFSNKIAILIANRLRATNNFKGEILPLPSGQGRESAIPSGAFNKAKKTDVNYSTLSGLELLVSIKTLGFRDVQRRAGANGPRIGRYTKNMVRNDHELRAEAMEFHERYPFAVLAALFFIPRDSCDDGAPSDKSSFAHAVMTFRSRAGRVRPDDPAQLFELFYIGLYDHSGPERGRVEFFDVMDPPRRNGVPRRLVSLDQVIKRIVEVYGLRNRLYIPFEEDEDDSESATPRLTRAADTDAVSDDINGEVDDEADTDD